MQDEKNISQLFEKFGVTEQEIVRNNPNLPLYSGEMIKVAKNSVKSNMDTFLYYVVKPMDTLEKVSSLFDVDEKDLKETNCLTTDKLFIGQKLKIKK